MENCQLLVKALKGNYNGSYKDIEKAIIEFTENNMKLLLNDEWYFPSCIIKEDILADGITMGTDKIILNKKIVAELMNGKKTSLITIFHELTHIKQNIQIENGITSPSIIRYIKDYLMNIYQYTENKKFKYNVASFYDVNYSCESSEIDANLNAIDLTIEFLKENNINYSEEEQIFKKLKYYLMNNNFTKRNLTNCITFNSYYLTLDDAFDVAIKYHPEWLKVYPQLGAEYILKDNSIEKKTKNKCKTKK